MGFGVYLFVDEGRFDQVNNSYDHFSLFSFAICLHEGVEDGCSNVSGRAMDICRWPSNNLYMQPANNAIF